MSLKFVVCGFCFLKVVYTYPWPHNHVYASALGKSKAYLHVLKDLRVTKRLGFARWLCKHLGLILMLVTQR